MKRKTLLSIGVRRFRIGYYALGLALAVPLVALAGQGCQEQPVEELKHVGTAIAPVFVAGGDNVICCPDINQCSDGDDLYEGCTMPAFTGTLGTQACPNLRARALVCKTCETGPGLGCDEGQADADSWTEMGVGSGDWECDGEVRRYANVSEFIGFTWLVNNEQEQCNSATWPCQGSDVCADISDVSCGACDETVCYQNDNSVPPNHNDPSNPCSSETGADCMDPAQQNLDWVGCCNISHECLPATTTADCATSDYATKGYDTPAWCIPCGAGTAERCTNGWEVDPEADPPSTLDPACSQFASCSDRVNGCIPLRFNCAGTLVDISSYPYSTILDQCPGCGGGGA